MDDLSPNAAAARAEQARTAREWINIVAKYREPSAGRSIFEIAVTAIPFFALWFLAYLASHVSYALTLLIAVPAAFFLVRLFLIQHDCGHGAFFKGKSANDWVGRVLGIFTMTPYAVWKRSHAIHHADSGNLDERGLGAIDTLTVDEYRALSWAGRLKYRLYRHPITMFVVGPAWVFIVQQRFPAGHWKNVRFWLSAMGTNLSFAAVFVGLCYLVGVGPALKVHLPIVALASSIGVWLFYIQHQFEHTYWEHQMQWNVHDAAFNGSSHYDLPQPLRWLTANIGIHHIHHLYARIPFYRLSEVLRDFPDLVNHRRMTLAQSIRCQKLKLWDEKNKALVAFNDVKL
ncbi:MAG: fatty acid desaturase [Hyphomicrobiaceae bacterium]|nr:fatty acid desaturase [Hyphomicrobiaceae bacterium]